MEDLPANPNLTLILGGLVQGQRHLAEAIAEVKKKVAELDGKVDDVLQGRAQFQTDIRTGVTSMQAALPTLTAAVEWVNSVGKPEVEDYKKRKGQVIKMLLVVAFGSMFTGGGIVTAIREYIQGGKP